MKKIVALLLIVIIASFIGAVYGIFHDQLTYSISPEYYTKFKFVQFRLESMGLGENIGTGKAPEIFLHNPRLGVTIVGVLATWWVGLIIGILLGLIGLFHTNGSTMFKVTIKAFLITMMIAFITGLAGLLFGKLFLLANHPNWYIADNVLDRDSFILVGSMHNFSYLGGLIGLAIGVIYTYNQKRKLASS